MLRWLARLFGGRKPDPIEQRRANSFVPTDAMDGPIMGAYRDALRLGWIKEVPGPIKYSPDVRDDS